jgi:gamma-glutamylcysteine synthetase
MIVLIAGMPRSGSTFSFNVAREILSARGSVYQEACDDVVGVVGRSDGADHVLVKTHNLDEPSLALARVGAMCIIVTVRRVEDAMASWFDAFGSVPEPTALDFMHHWICLFQHLRTKALIIPYNQIDRRPWLAVWRIARAICPIVYPSEVLAITRQLSKATVKRQTDTLPIEAPGVVDIGFSHYDARTLLHRRHVSDLKSRPAEQRLSPERLETVRAALGAAIMAAGLSQVG